MKYYGTPIDASEYELYDTFSESRGIYQYRRKNPKNTSNRKNFNSFYLKINKWSEWQNVGEMLGKIIAEKIGFKSCDTALYKSPRSFTSYYDTGVISYIEKSESDIVYSVENLIKKYREKQNIITQKDWYADIDTIFGAIFMRMQEKNRPYQEYLDFKQDFINMMIFDIKFLNPDRDFYNWLIREDNKTGKIDLYPMFDNAAILGFEEFTIQKYKGQEEYYKKQIEKFDVEKGRIAVTVPKEATKHLKEEQDSDYKTFLRYLLEKYPIETKKALAQTEKFTVKELKESLQEISIGDIEEHFEEIDIPRQEFAIDLFLQREKGMREVIKEYKENQRKKTEEQK